MKTLKNQKPTDYDIHLKYLCVECGQIHWLSFKESSTKGFKVVCDCGNIFQVKRTTGFSLKYKHKQIKSEITKVDLPKPKKEIPQNILNQAIKIMVSYGFTIEEASELLKKNYSVNPTKDIGTLIKQSLASIRSV